MYELPKYSPNRETLFNQANGDKFISSFYDQIKITCGKRRCKSHWIVIARHRILSRMWSNHMTELFFQLLYVIERVDYITNTVRALKCVGFETYPGLRLGLRPGT